MSEPSPNVMFISPLLTVCTEKEIPGTAASRMAAKTADNLVRTNGRRNDGPNKGEALREKTGENCFSGRDIVLPKQKS